MTRNGRNRWNSVTEMDNDNTATAKAKQGQWNGISGRYHQQSTLCRALAPESHCKTDEQDSSKSGPIYALDQCPSLSIP